MQKGNKQRGLKNEQAKYHKTNAFDNVIEAYRVQARRFNKKANELEKKFKRPK